MLQRIVCSATGISSAAEPTLREVFEGLNASSSYGCENAFVPKLPSVSQVLQ